MPPSSAHQFRVVIVGGGPVGLCLAHALSHAGIEYVLLERRDSVVEESGFGLALWPHGVRILDQLGLLEEAREIYLPMSDKYNYWPDGSEISHNNLYDKRILTSKKVISIDSHAQGVKVRCDDGSVEEGSIVIGCDGVHSIVRGIMRELALKSSAKTANVERPMAAQYQLLAGHIRRIPNLEPNRLWEIRNNALSMQIFMSEDQGWFLIYKRLAAPAYQYTRYTDEDAEAFAKEIMDYPVMQGMKFRDLWDVRKWVRLVNIEEGIVKNWHWDRIVLVGDSAHKMTPNAGLSVNQGFQGVAALTNILLKLLLKTPNPDTKALTAAFGAYQAQTEKGAKDSLWLSKLYTRTTSWHNILYKLADFAGPYLGGDLVLFRTLASPIVMQGLVLDFLPEPGYKAGRLKWANKVSKEKRENGVVDGSLRQDHGKVS
ncbi:hypothetical protein OIDMADRAFT_110104 [Oidiodendron maius Zn]|uniref:FAD-binding domain-containing protein n=1 Tax=Oidiodendron maius (strain Zn) TaxID=913774 RepID=A0A0C3HXA5_OIDMZ|nr:hypothetical protein OIDMADRAFT_110104 [Oidiodendron maius Zn]